MDKTKKINRFSDISNFPFKVLRMNPQEDTEGLHFHDFHELVIITKGTGTHVTGQERYVISPGDVFLIRPGISHGYRDTENLELINILYFPNKLKIPDFDLENQPGYIAFFELEPKLRAKHNFEGRLRLNIEDLMESNIIVSQIENEIKNEKSGFRYMAISHFMRLRGFLARCYASQKSESSQVLLRLGELLQYIDRNIEQPLPLSSLIKKARMSQSTLNRIFRQALNCSPIEYILKKRVIYASALMREKHLSVSEAAMESGFNDSNYFSRQFKKIMGIAPSFYRKTLVKRHP